MNESTSTTSLLEAIGTTRYYQAVLNDLHDEVLVIDPQDVVVDVNEPLLIKTGYARDEVLGQRCYQVSHHRSEPCYVSPDHPCPARQVWSTGQPARVTHLHYDATGHPLYVAVTASPLRGDNGDIVGIIEACRDITRERQMEERLRAVYALGHELTLLRDKHEIVARALAAGRGVLEDVALEFIPSDSAEVIHEEGRIVVPVITGGAVVGGLEARCRVTRLCLPADRQLVEMLADQASVALENARLHADLEQRYRDEQGRVVTMRRAQEELAQKYQEVEATVQALKDAQDRLVQGEKLAALGELVAGVAHELSNPLTSIMMYAQLLRQGAADERVRHDLERIVSQAQRATSVMRGLLDFARQHPPERRPVHMGDLLRGTLDLLSYELRINGIAWDLRVEPDLPLVNGDTHQLQQVFVNLINNAAQAMHTAHGGGRLAVSVDLQPAARGSSPLVRVTVCDDGPGIAPENLPRVFDPFFTTKPSGQGTGLGLSVCHGIISEHDGAIWVQSRLGCGATFFVELPASVEEPAPRAAPAVTEAPLLVTAPAPPPARVLLVDDEELVLEVMRRALQRAGYQADGASDASAALACLEREPYDLVVCDVHMPGMSGPDLYRTLQTRRPEQARRMLFVTGDWLALGIQRFLDETGAAYLSKPFELAALVERVGQELQRSAARER
jgi:PAS domain S-box-containing protein